MKCLKKSKLDNGDNVFIAVLTVIGVFESTFFGLAIKVITGSCKKRIIFLISVARVVSAVTNRMLLDIVRTLVSTLIGTY